MDFIKIDRDINGNKIVKLSFADGTRGFSIQTLGNLPVTHRMTKDNIVRHITIGEINAYVKKYGTKRQKKLLGWY